MSEPERIAYSRHECAALCGAGIWFENRLMQLVLRHLAELPVTVAGAPLPAGRGGRRVPALDDVRRVHPPGRHARLLAARPTRRELDALGGLAGGRAIGYLLILAVEELLDAANRATMKDDRVHPVSRQIAKLHVLEEARHVSFAKTYLTEVWPTLDDDERAAVAELAPAAVADVADLMVDPAVYDELGIEAGADQARANPHHRARIVEGLAKLTGFLTELGVVAGLDPARVAGPRPGRPDAGRSVAGWLP